MKAIKWLALSHLLKYIAFLSYIILIVNLAYDVWIAVPFFIFAVGSCLTIFIIDIIFIFKAFKEEKDDTKKD